MVEHLVLFQLKPEATHAQVDAMLEGLRGLKDAIDTVVELSCGRNFSERSQGNNIGLRVLFADRAGLEVYQPHPAHQGCVTTLIRPIVDLVTVVDYEV